MRYNYDSGTGIASITAQTDLNEWEKVAYVCLVDAYIDESSEIARSYDFVFVTVLGAAFGSANSPPSFSGLEPEYSVTYPGELTGSFTIRETDEGDLSTLIATIAIGGDFAEDCDCMELQASYAGESGLVEKADLITAIQQNVALKSITVEFTVTPTEEMIGKTYELSITVADTFASTTGVLKIVTEAEETEETEEVDLSDAVVSSDAVATNEYAE